MHYNLTVGPPVALSLSLRYPGSILAAGLPLGGSAPARHCALIVPPTVRGRLYAHRRCGRHPGGRAGKGGGGGGCWRRTCSVPVACWQHATFRGRYEDEKMKMKERSHICTTFGFYLPWNQSRVAARPSETEYLYVKPSSFLALMGLHTDFLMSPSRSGP